MIWTIFLSCLSPIERINCSPGPVGSQECKEVFGFGAFCNPTGFCDGCNNTEDPHQTCRDNFGLGSVCVAVPESSNPDLFDDFNPSYKFASTLDDSYCEDARPFPRCENSIPEDLWYNWEQYQDAYLIGQMFDFSSDQANIVAAEMAFDTIAENDELTFIQISCNYENDDDGELEDYLEEVEAVSNVATHLVDYLGVKVIIGPAGSDDVLTSYGIVQDKAVLISPSATAQSLQNLDAQHNSNGDLILDEEGNALAKTDDQPGTFWRTVGSDALQARVLASQVLNSHLTTGTSINAVGLIKQDSAYGNEFAETFEKSIIAESNDTIDVYQESYAVNAFDSATFAEIWGDLTDSGIGVVVFISSDTPDIVEFIQYIATDTLHDDILIFLTDSAADKDVLNQVSSTLSINENLSSRILGTKPAVPAMDPDAAFSGFAEDLEEDYNVSAFNNVYAAYSYDAAWMSFSGLAWAHYWGADDGTSIYPNISALDIAKGLRRSAVKRNNASAEFISFDMDGWNTLITAFQSGEDVNVNVSGASGSLDYNPDTEEVVSPVEIWTIVSEDTNEFSFETQLICYNTDQCCDPAQAPCEHCTDEVDNDDDGYIDCDDSECQSEATCND